MIRLAASVMLAMAVLGCERRPPTPVAPFSERLATTLPWRDVIGLVRIVPGEGALKSLIGGTMEPSPLSFIKTLASAKRTLAGPPLTLFELAFQGEFVGAGEPLAVLLLDPSVHGALCGFAWRGPAAKFIDAARRSGLVVDGSRVWLPGRGRIDGLSALARDIAASTNELRPDWDRRDPAPRGPAEMPHVRYDLMERDGLSLLLPARDGAAHVVDTLVATGLLDRATGNGLVVRLELGAAAAEMKDELRNQLHWFASSSVWDYASRGQDAEEFDWQGANRLYRQLFEPLQEVIRGGIETLVSIEHVFVVEREGAFDWFVRAEPGGFFADALMVLRNRPLGQLVSGAPDEARALLAASLDPATLAEVPAMLRRAQDASGGGGGHRRRRALHEAIERAVEGDLAATEAEEDADELPFLEVFGGRFWIAAGPPPEREKTPSLLDLLKFGRKNGEAAPLEPVAPEGDGEAGAPAGGGAATGAESESAEWCARLYTELPRDDGNHGLLESLLNFALEPHAMGVVRAAVAPTNLWSLQRVGGGLVEAVGREASGIAAADRVRLERDPEAAPPLPANGPASACAALRLAFDGGPGSWWCVEALPDGLWFRQLAAAR